MAYTGMIKRGEEDENKINDDIGIGSEESGELSQPVETEEMPVKVQEEGNEEEAKERLKILYEERWKIKELLYGAENEIDANKKAVRDVSGKTGIAVKGGKMIKISESTREEFARQERLAESEIAGWEKEALRIPSDLEEKKPQKEYEKYRADVKKMESDIKEAREKFVKKFIEESAEKTLLHFEFSFAEAENGVFAQSFAEFKIEKEIELAAKRFIEEGGRPDFGFLAILEISSFEDEKQGELKYITGFSVKILDSEHKVRDVDARGGVPLVLGKDRRKIWDAKRGKEGIKKEKKR